MKEGKLICMDGLNSVGRLVIPVAYNRDTLFKIPSDYNQNWHQNSVPDSVHYSDTAM